MAETAADGKTELVHSELVESEPLRAEPAETEPAGSALVEKGTGAGEQNDAEIDISTSQNSGPLKHQNTDHCAATNITTNSPVNTTVDQNDAEAPKSIAEVDKCLPSSLTEVCFEGPDSDHSKHADQRHTQSPVKSASPSVMETLICPDVAANNADENADPNQGGELLSGPSKTADEPMSRPNITATVDGMLDRVDGPDTPTAMDDPDTTLMSPPASRITRRVTRKKQRTQRLVDINTTWTIGQSDPPACGTCKKTKGASRRVKLVSPTAKGDPVQFVDDSQISSGASNSVPKDVIQNMGSDSFFYSSQNEKKNCSDCSAETAVAVGTEELQAMSETNENNCTKNVAIKTGSTENGCADIGGATTGHTKRYPVENSVTENDSAKNESTNVNSTVENSDQNCPTLVNSPSRLKRKRLVNDTAVSPTAADVRSPGSDPTGTMEKTRRLQPSVVPTPSPSRRLQQLVVSTPSPSRRSGRTFNSPARGASPQIKRNAKGETPLHVATIKVRICRFSKEL